MTLSKGQLALLHAIASGQTLKAHRDIEGNKAYLLHPLQGAPEPVTEGDVQALCELGLLDSNKKFPAATFWLTEAGRRALEQAR